MPNDFIFKTLVLGFPGIGKTTFLNSNEYSETTQFAGRSSLGVSFQVVNNIIENEFRIKLQLWDFKTSSRFIDYYPVFCRGTSACVLCFDISDGNSFNFLHHWIRLVRFSEQGRRIPIFLIGLKCDLIHEVSNEEIFDLTSQYNLDGIYFYSINDIHKKHLIFNSISNYMVKDSHPFLHLDIRDKHLNYLPSRSQIYSELDELRGIIANIEGYAVEDNGYLSREDKENYYAFLDYFSTCPVCSKLLHISYLTKFYFNTAPENIKFKETLLNLMDDSGRNNKVCDKIHIGIPCCECYKEIFDSNSN